MPGLVDPSNALASLQEMYRIGDPPRLQRGALCHSLYFFVDNLHERPRFVYFTAEHRSISALAMLASVEPMKGAACFQLGYAVAAAHRREGRGKNIVMGAIDELVHGFAKMRPPAYYIEAVVGLDNVASQKIAAVALSAMPAPITDSQSGLPALHYVRKVDS